MTRGVLLFAHNNQQVNYGAMAYWLALRVRDHLGVGTSLVTDRATARALDEEYPQWRDRFQQVFLQESLATQTKRYGTPDNQLTFHNLDRTDAWALTPYDETLLMDTDLVIQTPALAKLWGSNEDYVACDWSTDLYGNTDAEFTWVSDHSIKFYWATVFYFRKTPATEQFFKKCQWVKQHYSWLCYVYKLPSGPMRNDFVWSIALHSLGEPIATIPFNTMHSNFEDRIIEMNSQAVRFLTPLGVCKITADVHVFNKFDLMEQIQGGLI
jgi:hypothetical protein